MLDELYHLCRVALNRSYEISHSGSKEYQSVYISSDILSIISDIDCLNLAAFLPHIYCQYIKLLKTGRI